MGKGLCQDLADLEPEAQPERVQDHEEHPKPVDQDALSWTELSYRFPLTSRRSRAVASPVPPRGTLANRGREPRAGTSWAGLDRLVRDLRPLLEARRAGAVEDRPRAAGVHRPRVSPCSWRFPARRAYSSGVLRDWGSPGFQEARAAASESRCDALEGLPRRLDTRLVFPALTGRPHEPAQLPGARVEPAVRAAGGSSRNAGSTTSATVREEPRRRRLLFSLARRMGT